MDGRRSQGRSLATLATGLIGAMLVVAVVVQDGGSPTGLASYVQGSWERDHSADPSERRHCFRQTAPLLLICITHTRARSASGVWQLLHFAELPCAACAGQPATGRPPLFVRAPGQQPTTGCLNVFVRATRQRASVKYRAPHPLHPLHSLVCGLW